MLVRSDGCTSSTRRVAREAYRRTAPPRSRSHPRWWRLGALRSARRYPLRRRAADGGHRASAHGQAAPPPARRAVARLAPVVVDEVFDALARIGAQGSASFSSSRTSSGPSAWPRGATCSWRGRVAAERSSAELRQSEAVRAAVSGPGHDRVALAAVASRRRPGDCMPD
jgi:hypothetical protein